MDNIPNELLAIIFSFLPDSYRICHVALVCKRWYDVVYSSYVWKLIDFGGQRKITTTTLERFVFPSTKKINLYECRGVTWTGLVEILKKCKTLTALNLAWIGLIGFGLSQRDPIPNAFTTLSIANLKFLDLSHCNVSDYIFKQLAIRCNLLEILILLDCQDISEEAYMSSDFKQHGALKLLCIAYNRAALSMRCVIELLRYTGCNVLLDIRGNTLSPEDFLEITEIHRNAMTRIQNDVETYRHMLLF